MKHWLLITEVHVFLHSLQAYINKAAYTLEEYFCVLEITYMAALKKVRKNAKHLYEDNDVHTNFFTSVANKFCFTFM
jgi:hypothetical protein